MRIPGFTAEKSMTDSSRDYQHTMDFADSSERLTVTPQRMKLKTVRCNCNIDVCVCEDGTVLNTWTGVI